MRVTFYFDPSCPWTWLTCRWLVKVEAERNIEIRWDFYSLTLKHGKLDLNDVHPAHQMLRVLAAVDNQKSNQAVGQLYTELGKRWHIEGDSSTAVIKPSLEAAGLDEVLAEAAKDDSWDQTLQNSLEAAAEDAGKDVGSPIISFPDENNRRGFFGPIITEMPSNEDCLALWDSISRLAGVADFYEFKRTRDSGPDVSSTKDSV